MCFTRAMYADGPAFCTTVTRKARKARTCCECDDPIPAGEVYHHTAGKWDGSLLTFDQCQRCVKLLDAIRKVETDEGCRGAAISTCYGGLFEEVEDWPHYAEEFRKRGWDDVAALVPA